MAQSPSIDQYVESVPTTRGSKPPPQGGGGGGAELPADLRRRIEQQAGADAEDLAAIAGDPGLGAPERQAAGGAGNRAKAAPDGAGEKGALGSATEAVRDSGGGGGMLFLLGGALATAAAVGGAALARRRRLSV